VIFSFPVMVVSVVVVGDEAGDVVVIVMVMRER
jgi:hypothetical protein